MNKHLSFAKELTNKLELPMKIISVEENEEGLLTFHFSAESRVEIRELVKKLQEETKQKISMHQVTPRDEAKFLSRVGPCGEKLCCATFLKTFPALQMEENATGGKVGVCGKPACCLTFEETRLSLQDTPQEQLEKNEITDTPPPKANKPSPRRILRVLPPKKGRHRR